MSTIITAPNPVLSLEAKPVLKIDSHVQKIIKEMKVTLSLASDPEGVGLAAPQIGESLQIFIAKPSPKEKVIVFINPQILEMEQASKIFTRKRRVGKKKKQVQKLEGCLSLKDIWGTVLRSPKITMSYQDETGKIQTKEFKDFLATIIQHEYDHLHG